MIAVFLVEVLRLALAAKMCPDQPRAFKKINNTQPGVSVGITPFFLNESVPGTVQVLQAMSAISLAQTCEDLTA